MESSQEKILRLTEEFVAEMEYRIPSTRGQWLTERTHEKVMSIRLPYSLLNMIRSRFMPEKNLIISISANFYRRVRILPSVSNTEIDFDRIDFGEEIVETLVTVAGITKHPLYEMIRPNPLSSLIIGFEEGSAKS